MTVALNDLVLVATDSQFSSRDNTYRLRSIVFDLKRYPLVFHPQYQGWKDLADSRYAVLESYIRLVAIVIYHHQRTHRRELVEP